MDAPADPAPQPRPRGFTLLEALVALAVAAVLVATAVPALGTLVLDARRTAALNAFVSGLHLARSAAVRHGRPVVMCPSAGGRACLGQPDWSGGWLIFIDADGDGRRARDERRLRVHGPLAPGAHLRSGRRAWVRYQPLGTAGGSTITVTYCDRRGAREARAIIVSNTGRPRVAERRSDGSPLACN